MRMDLPGRPWQVRQTSLEIDLGRLRANYARLKKRAGAAELLVLVKSDGYGLSAKEVSLALDGLPAKAGLLGYGVANVEEGIGLRRDGVKRRIFVMSGIQRYDRELDRCLHTLKLTPVIASLPVLEACAATVKKARTRRVVHLKFNTGMNRLGLDPAERAAAFRLVQRTPGLEVEGLLSHLASGENARHPRTRRQVAEFRRVVEEAKAAGLEPRYVHLANSGGLATKAFPEGNLARVGLHLYGVGDPALKPVARWTAQIYQIRELAKGDEVGYGGRFRAPRRLRMATLGVGYGDGYRRALSGKAEVLIRGQRCPVLGSVSMDLTAVDISRVPNATVRDHATLLGRDGRDEITADELAEHANTISWEILTGIAPRVPRNFIR